MKTTPRPECVISQLFTSTFPVDHWANPVSSRKLGRVPARSRLRRATAPIDPDGRVPEPAFPWLFVVARNLVLHYHRRRLDDQTETVAPAARDDATAALLARDEAEYLLGLLTPGQQHVLRHVYLHERTPLETAHLLGMSTEAVHQQLSRGLRAARAIAQAQRHDNDRHQAVKPSSAGRRHQLPPRDSPSL